MSDQSQPSSAEPPKPKSATAMRTPRVPLSHIEIDRASRQRRDLCTPELIESIKARGVLVPIIVTANPPGSALPYRLIAGERRLACSHELGLPTIPVRLLADLSPAEAQLIELEENLRRKDLHWLDYCRAMLRLHQLFAEASPDPAKWTLSGTADKIGVSVSTVSRTLTTARAFAPGEVLEGREKQWGSFLEVCNYLERMAQRKLGELDPSMLEVQDDGVGTESGPSGPTPTPAKPGPSASAPAASPTQPSTTIVGAIFTPPPRLPASPLVIRPASQSILHESFLHWAPKYSGPKFNLIHCDFPYGIKVFAGLQSGRSAHQTYDDSEDVYFQLLDCLLTNLDRIMGQNAHLVFWYSEKHGQETRRRVTEFNAKTQVPLLLAIHPLIWVKSDNSGIAGDAKRSPRHVYETALFGVRGGRNLVKTAGDAYSAPTDRALHPSAKPEPVLKHFFTMLVDQSTRLLDPTCGSGSALRAAEALGASQVLGMDSDETTVGGARIALNNARTIRAASRNTKAEPKDE